MQANTVIDLSIIVVNWNGKALLEKCLYSVFEKSQGVSFEVIVVDNASADGSVDMVKQDFPQVRLLVNETNLGFSKANNRAIPLSNSPYVLLLNNDVELVDNCIGQIFSYLENNCNVGVVGCQLLNLDGSHQVSYAAFPTLANVLRGRLFSDTTVDLRAPSPAECISAALVMIRRQVFRDVGLLDENIFMYGEDYEWCFRAHKANWKIHYLPDSRAIHVCGASRVKKMDDIEFVRSNFIGWKVFYERHFSQTDWMLFKVVLMLSSLFRLITWIVVKPLISVIRPSRLASVNFKITRWHTFLVAAWRDKNHEEEPA